MSVVSMFFGIVIRIYRGEEYGLPHFHASYQKHNAVFTIEGDIVAGSLPKKQLKFIAAWTEIHREELIADWELALREEPLFPIDPLR